MDWLQGWSESAMTALGFFWKAGWAFVFGYTVSAMIQAFVPRARLARHMGRANLRSVSLATVFGAASSSCSFAALAAARSLVLKGAHFIAAVAFMFASTNLVVELGILIAIFLGWEFVVAELIGGVLLIGISSVLIRLTYPRSWIERARERLEEEEPEEDDFDWKERIRSRDGWNRVGHRFVMDWKMVWEEITIGFTVAGLVAVLVPSWFWTRIFLTEGSGADGSIWIALENAAVAPFVAAATFIGSMGNIPLATVLNSNGVLFAGVMGFIYSDLMVPPLVAVNAKYYGKRVALYVAAIMYVSIVITALILHALFGALGITPESGREMDDVSRFAIDYTFFLNIAMAALAVGMIALHRSYVRDRSESGDGDSGSAITPKRIIVWAMVALVLGGLGVELSGLGS